MTKIQNSKLAYDLEERTFSRRVETKVVRFFIIFNLFLLVISPPVYAQNYIQVFKNGMIDWSNRIAEGKGIGFPPEETENLAQSRALARKEAIGRARINLFEVIGRVRIDSRTSIKDFVDKNHNVHNKIEEVLKKSQLVDVVYLPDGSVKAIVSLRLTGFLADLALPRSIRKINPIQQPALTGKEKDAPFTGLIVDCRGFKLQPAMVPRIFSEDGKEIFGSVSVSREYAVNKGVAAYVRGFEKSRINLRVGNRPLTMKGIRTAKTGPVDIVISNADAARIRGNAGNLKFLKECRVMIILE